jgi:hypothetical protein
LTKIFRLHHGGDEALNYSLQAGNPHEWGMN